MCSPWRTPHIYAKKARSLRLERRLTIDELAARLALPRTTIYYWVRDLPIPGSGPGVSRARLQAWMDRVRSEWR